MSDLLFPDAAPDAPRPSTDDRVPRFATANRAQIELQPCDLEALLPLGHAARLVWRFVEGLDLSQFYATIRAYEGGAGRTPIDPKILVALWLYATIDGVGSAREVDRLCYRHDAYRWLRGGVSVNHHTLADFRVAHQAALDDLLTQSIATLRHGGIVTLARVAQDGTRVRGSAGAGSFRREGTLQACLTDARKQVERTAKQADAAVNTRTAAAQQRAAAERLARVEEALAQLPAVAAIKAKQGQKATGEPRVSTTDPDARVMKMADGGFRPAYNVHLATDVDSRVILDTPGAEQLLGRGDMLLLRSDAAKLGRVQGCFVADDEISQVVEFWKQAVPPPATPVVPPWNGLMDQLEQEDDIVQDAMDVLRGMRTCSTSMLQRKLRIGYPKAARLMEQLESQGIVGPDMGGGQGREVLLKEDESAEEDEEEMEPDY